VTVSANLLALAKTHKQLESSLSDAGILYVIIQDANKTRRWPIQWGGARRAATNRNLIQHGKMGKPVVVTPVRS
jgi:hypothetical protein